MEVDRTGLCWAYPKNIPGGLDIVIGGDKLIGGESVGNCYKYRKYGIKWDNLNRNNVICQVIQVIGPYPGYCASFFTFSVS